MEVFYKLTEHLNTYFQSTDISLTLLSPEGETVETFGPSCPYCAIFQESCGRYVPCQRAHASACREAARLGEGYIFRCPGGCVLFAVPVYREDTLPCSVLAGPITLEYPDLDLIDEIIQRFHISLDYRSRLYGACSGIPLVEPHRARYLCKLLDAVTAGAVLLEEKQRAAGVPAGKVGELVRALREQEGEPMSWGDQERRFMADVAAGDREHAKAVLNEMLGRIYFTSGNNLEIIRTRFFELLAMLARMVVEKGGDREAVYRMMDEAVRNTSRCGDLTELSFAILDTLDAFTSVIFMEYRFSDVPSLHKALDYIEENYTRPITLEEVAEQAALNPSYFSALFKRKMKITFSGYVTEKRVERAKQLLKGSNATLVEIALALGFENQSYFSSVFKRHTGMTPRQFRSSRT